MTTPDGEEEEKGYESSMVFMTDTNVDPNTVMIHFQ